jgi:hypothetical protein
MTTNTNDGDGFEPREENDDDGVMDWALGEGVGAERVPDLVAGVRARLAAGQVADSRVVPSSSSRWWAAAIVLLGAMVVVGVATWPREHGDTAPANSQDRVLPKPVSVNSLADVAALPATTRAVEAVGVDDAVIAALADRVRDLEVLIVREPWNEAFGLGLKMTAPKPALHVTAGAWDSVLRLKKLRRIEFSGAVLVGRVGPERMADFATGLESLPALEALTLRCLDTKDAVLQVLGKARSLRRLDLSFNHGFGEDGVRTIATLKTLRSLSLRGCQQLHGNVLAQLAALPELEELDVSAIDGINWRASSAEPDDDEARATRRRAKRIGDRIGMGPNDTALEAFADMPKLRVLDISGGHYFTGQGLATLGRCTTLRELDASGLREGGGEWVRALPVQLECLEVCGEHTDAFCTAVAERLTALRHLNIAACDRITDAGLAAVAGMPSLRILDMRQMRGLTAACIDSLATSTQLEELDMRHCDFVTAEHVARLQRSLPKLRTLQTSVPPELLPAAETAEKPATVKDMRSIERLPTDQRAVVGVGLDDAALAALATHQSLEVVELETDRRVRPRIDGDGRLTFERTKLTTAGLAELAKLPKLRRLRLSLLDELALEALVGCASLTEIEFEGMRLAPSQLQALGRLPLRVLAFVRCQLTDDSVLSIATLPSLRELTIDGGSSLALGADALVAISKLPLERLVLAGIQGKTITANRLEFSTTRPGDGYGVTTRVLAAIGTMASLRDLDITGGEITAESLRSLHTARALRRLRGVPGLGALLAHLPPQLEALDLSRGEVDKDFALTLATATPSLQRLSFGDTNLTDETLASMQAIRSLRHLDLSNCTLTSAAAGVRELRRMPNLKVLETDKGREVLRK